MSCGDRAANRLELEAWTYSLNRTDLRARLAENTIALRSAIATALARITNRRESSADVQNAALMIETVALGLVATAALDRGDDVRNVLSLAITNLANPAGALRST